MNGVVRIIAPSSTNQQSGGSTTPYPSFTDYLTHLQTGGPGSTPIMTTIAGQNGQIPKAGPFQNYSFNAYISNTAQTVNGMTVHPRRSCDERHGDARGASSPLTILVTRANLSSFAIYGANPAYTICSSCQTPTRWSRRRSPTISRG